MSVRTPLALEIDLESSKFFTTVRETKFVESVGQNPEKIHSSFLYKQGRSVLPKILLYASVCNIETCKQMLAKILLNNFAFGVRLNV